jgi:pimeloyl-ACP methyl ester carboxylesterase
MKNPAQSDAVQCGRALRSGAGLKRRTLLTGAATATAASLVAGLKTPALAQAQRKTFVLVHGAWHGGWCWRDVRDALTSSGHRVFTPTLTGLAESSHLLSTSITLDTHIKDIVNLFWWEDIEDAVLVAHSYGGWVCSGALEEVVDQVDSLVFVDAFVPRNGQSPRDTNSPERKAELDEAIAKGEAGRPVPDASFFRIIDPENVAWVQSKMTPQPTNTTTQALNLTDARERVGKKLYIRAPRFPNATFDQYFADAAADPTWGTYAFAEDEAGHDVMVDAPVRLAELLVGASQ